MNMLGTRKRRVLDYLYNTSPVTNTTVVCLAGPNVEEVIDDAKRVAGIRKICVYDLIADYLPEPHANVLPYNMDVVHATPSRFMDLDFCATIKSTFRIIRKLFTAQRDKYDRLKVFQFTYSTRGVRKGLIELLLQKLVDRKVKFTKDRVNKNRYIYSDNDYFIEKISYSDTTPMAVIRIIYGGRKSS